MDWYLTRNNLKRMNISGHLLHTWQFSPNISFFALNPQSVKSINALKTLPATTVRQNWYWTGKWVREMSNLSEMLQFSSFQEKRREEKKWSFQSSEFYSTAFPLGINWRVKTIWRGLNMRGYKTINWHTYVIHTIHTYTIYIYWYTLPIYIISHKYI